jgi:CRISPR-associated endonuclease Cas1
MIEAPAGMVESILERTPADQQTLVADGFGLSLAVEGGQLVVCDGIGKHRRERELSRSQRTIKRLVILGHTGFISLDAMRWCSDVGLGLLVIDPEGFRLLAVNAPGTHDDARLRRSQAQAAHTEVGLEIARTLLKAKLEGQANVARTGFGDLTLAETITRYAAELQSASAIDRCVLIESNAAGAYFQAWSGLRVKFPTNDQTRVPDGWLSYDQRSSVLANFGSPRSATNPINALLNYCYALAYAEAVIACHALGLDPGLGILHNDKPNRNSLALDLMEPVRPGIDAFVLDLIRSHTFSRTDFHETRDGRCRILAPLTHELAETIPSWAEGIAPHAESVAHQLAAAADGTVPPRRPLTGKPKTSPRRKNTPTQTLRPQPRCPDCGGELGDKRRIRCPTCHITNRATLAEQRLDLAQQRLRDRAEAAGVRPDGNTMRAAKASVNRAAATAWEAQNADARIDQDHYRNEILPLLAAHPVAKIAETLGIAMDAAWRIREGTLTPHARHWTSLSQLGGGHARE